MEGFRRICVAGHAQKDFPQGGQQHAWAALRSQTHEQTYIVTLRLARLEAKPDFEILI
jgi:hypothetical protein